MNFMTSSIKAWEHKYVNGVLSNSDTLHAVRHLRIKIQNLESFSELR